MTDDNENDWDLGANATGGAVGAVLGIVLGSPLGPAGQVVGALGGAAAEDYVKRYARDRARRARAMALAAAEAADVAPDRLIEAIIEDERKRELLARAVEEGARSINDQNIRAIAHAFAIGALASDSAVVDDAMIAIDIIGQLGATHWRLISILMRKSQMTGLDPTREETVKRYQFAWTREEIYNLDPGIKQAFDPVIGRLTGLGIALDLAIGTWDYQPRWALTDFGKTCAEYMRVIGTALPPE